MKPKVKLKPTNTDAKTYLYVFSLLIVLIVLLYANTISHDYNIDDDLVSQNHPIIQKGFEGIPEIFTSYYFIDKKMQFGYRPMVMTSFAIEHQFFGQNPHVSHFFNLLFYIINCFLIFIVIQKIFPRIHFAFSVLVTVLFVVHPIHTEVVCSIKSRDELLSFILSLLTLLLVFRYVRSKKTFWLPIIMLTFVMGIFSKQTAYSFLFVIPLSLHFSELKIDKKTFLFVLMTLLSGVFIASLPRYLLPPVEREIFFFENPLVLSTGFSDRLLTAFYVFFFYIIKLIYPHPLVFYYGYNMIPIPVISNPIVILSFIISIGFAFFVIVQFPKKHLLSFAIIYFVITISMFLNIIEPVAGIVAERFAYYASLGFCMALAFGIFKILRIAFEAVPDKKRIKFLIMLSLVFIIPYFLIAKNRTKDWENHSVLYANDIKHLENSALANAIYADMAINEIYTDHMNGRQPRDMENKLALAVKHYSISIDVYDGYFSSYNNLAFIYYQFFKDYEKAIPLLEKAIELRSDYTEAYFNLAYCYQMLMSSEKAIINYEKTIALDSNFYNAYTNLGEIYAMNADWQNAEGINVKLKNRLPENDLPYINLGKIYLMQGDTIQSMMNFEKAAELAPDNLGLLSSLLNFYERRNDVEKALYYQTKINQIQHKK
ncbi:MAG: hypothetical protein PHT69_01180 [Bacteroidales bacterium]|nr:hypothetical protein [Bacteroidales bacterium]